MTGRPHHRRAQVWHALSMDRTVLHANDTFINERNEPQLVLIFTNFNTTGYEFLICQQPSF